jgi:hypothetical protein
MKKSFDFTVDIRRTVSNLDYELVAGDTGNAFLIRVTDDSEPVDLTDAAIVAAFAPPGASAPVCQDLESGVTITDAENGLIKIALMSGAFFSGGEGRVKAELTISKTNVITTARFSFKVRKPILNGETILATNEFPLLERLIGTVEALEENYRSAVTSATVNGVNTLTIQTESPLTSAQEGSVFTLTMPGGVVRLKKTGTAALAAEDFETETGGVSVAVADGDVTADMSVDVFPASLADMEQLNKLGGAYTLAGSGSFTVYALKAPAEDIAVVYHVKEAL